MQLSKNFRLEEFTRSETATRRGIINIPDEEAIKNLTILCRELLQPLRDACNYPLPITSGYRSKTLNEAVGGSKTSDHMQGRAADIASGNPLALLAWVLRLHLSFDQAIVYSGFLHLSFRSKETNRKQVIQKQT